MGSAVHTITIKRPPFRTSRPHDYLYDPNCILSGERDHNRAALNALKEVAKFNVRPYYKSMFSELSHVPRNAIEVTFRDVPAFVDKSWQGRRRTQSYPEAQNLKVDIAGADRYKFYRRPVMPFLHPLVPGARFSTTVPDDGAALGTRAAPTTPAPPNSTKGTQTDYRDSETQTDPYAPPYRVQPGYNPEVLTLATLSWGKGLPAGVNEVEIIERARAKRHWENTMPQLHDVDQLDKRRKMMEEIERDEWAFREKELSEIHAIRMELAEKVMKDRTRKLSEKLSDRISRQWTQRSNDMETKMEKVRLKHERDIRRLARKYGAEEDVAKMKKQDVVSDYAAPSSKRFAPLTLLGRDPKDDTSDVMVRSKLLDTYKGLLLLETEPGLIKAQKEKVPEAPSFHEYSICEVGWRNKELFETHGALKERRIRGSAPPGPRRPLRLIIRIEHEVPRPDTPTVDAVPDQEEDIYQATVLIQKILRGRTVQNKMFLGRRRVQELIAELRETHALQEAGINSKRQNRLETLAQQRKKTVSDRKNELLQEALSHLEGEAAARMLDFLSKELIRLQDERAAHALAMLAERKRRSREAAEAGRRQMEERRRREHDEIFKQVLKVHQATVDLYLEDAVIYAFKETSDEQARHYVRELAKIVDQASLEAEEKHDDLELEETVADLVHNFVLPEAQKTVIREKIRNRQTKFLLAAHEAVYGHLENQYAPTQDDGADFDDFDALQEPQIYSKNVIQYPDEEIGFQTDSEVEVEHIETPYEDEGKDMEDMVAEGDKAEVAYEAEGSDVETPHETEGSDVETPYEAEGSDVEASYKAEDSEAIASYETESETTNEPDQNETLHELRLENESEFLRGAEAELQDETEIEVHNATEIQVETESDVQTDTDVESEPQAPTETSLLTDTIPETVTDSEHVTARTEIDTDEESNLAASSAEEEEKIKNKNEKAEE